MDELVIQVQRVIDALERMAGVRSKTLEDDLISWLESGGKETETVKKIDKEQDKEVVEEKCDNEWSEMDIEDRGDENDGMEGVEEEIGTPVLSM